MVCFVFMEWVRSFVVFFRATVLLRFTHFAKGFFRATLHGFVFYFGQPLYFVIKRVLFVIAERFFVYIHSILFLNLGNLAHIKKQARIFKARLVFI